MSRQSKCKICTGDPAINAQINSMLESRVKLKVIATEIPHFSIYQLSRHRNRCLAPNAIIGELLPDVGSDELRIWMQRCEDAYHLATTNGDSRSAIAACSAATRQLSALHKKLEKEAEQAATPDDDPSRKVSIGYLDGQLKEFLAQRDNETGGAMAKCQSLWMEEPEFSQLVLNIWKDRSTLPALLAASDTNYLQRETTTTNATAND